MSSNIASTPGCQVPKSHLPKTITSFQEYRRRKAILQNPEERLLYGDFTIFHPHLSKTLGYIEALILGNLFSLGQGENNLEIPMSRDDWHRDANLPGVPISAIRKALRHLTDEGILIHTLDRFHDNRSLYNIVFSRLEERISGDAK